MKTQLLTTLIFLSVFSKNISVKAQTWQWAREEAANGEGYGLACDNSGNVFVSGGTSGAAVIGTFTSPTTGANAVLVKYDPDGHVLWANYIPGAFGFNVACDASGNAFLCGYLSGTTVVGSQTLVSQGLNDILLVKYS